MNDDRTPEEIRDDKNHAVACQLVGDFMLHWSFLEDEVNDSIRRLFNAPMIEGLILVKNIWMQRKLDILAAIFAEQSLLEGKWQQDAAKLISNIGSLNGDRNTVVHNGFTTDAQGRVKFYVISTRGKFDLPNVKWSRKVFETKRDDILLACQQLEDTTNELIRARKERGGSDSIWKLYGLARENPQDRQPQGRRDSDTPQATREKSSRTKRSPPHSRKRPAD